MIYHYIRSFSKKFNKNWIITSINILGLSIGMVSAFLAAKYIGFSQTSDNTHNNRDRIFHISQTEMTNGDINYDGRSSYRGVATVSFSEIPEVVNYTKFDWHVETLIFVEKDDKSIDSFNQTGIFSVDTSFTQIFTLKPIFGILKGALNNPNSVILTETIAKKYFGTTNPIGKSMRSRVSWGEEHIWTVTCVVKDPPNNTKVPFNILVASQDYTNDPWQTPEHNQYLLLQDSENYKEVSKKITDVINAKQIFEGNNKHISILLNPLKPEFSKFEISLISMGVLIMIPSWISFSNLSIAQFAQRQREVFIRRSVGANNAQLIKQYLFETGLILLLAITLSILFLFGAYNYFNTLTQNHLLPLLNDGFYINTLSISVFVIGGFLPSIYILTTLLIKNSVIPNGTNTFRLKSGITKRKVLAGLQFGVAIIMITFTYVMGLQTQYLYELDKGFDHQNKLIIKPPKDLPEGKWTRTQTFRDKLSEIAWISNVASSSTIPGQSYRQEANFSLLGSDNKIMMYVNAGSKRFLSSYQVKILSGENFPSGGDPSNKSNVLINEVSMELLGLNLSNAVGQRISDENDNVYTYYRSISKLSQDLSKSENRPDDLPI